MTTRTTCKVLNRTLTVCGVEKRIFYFVVAIAGSTWFGTRQWKLALALFVIGEFFGFLATRSDDKFIEVCRRVFKVKSVYDPIKHDQFTFRVRR